MSLSNVGEQRPPARDSRVDSDKGSFISASADVLKDSQDGGSDEEDRDDRAFAQVYHEVVKTYAPSEEDKERYADAKLNGSCDGPESFDSVLLVQNKRPVVM